MKEPPGAVAGPGPGRTNSIWNFGNPYPFTNPPIYVISHGYDMDITTSAIWADGCEIPVHGGPSLLFANLNYLSSYTNKSIYA